MKAAVVVLLALVAAAYANVLPRQVEEGYFAGRSGNMILTKPLSSSASVSFFTHPQSTLEHMSQTTFPPKYVADVVARSLGMSPFHAEYVPQFLSTNVLNSARANFMLSIVGLEKSIAADLALENINALSQSSFMTSDLDVSLPYTPLATAVSIASGASPSAHGIVAPSWVSASGSRVRAFSAPFTASASETANLATIMAQTSSGQSTVLSVSANNQLAMAHCVHPAVLSKDMDTFQGRVACLALDAQGSFSAVMGTSPLAQSADDILERFGASVIPSAQFDQTARKFTVGSVDFDLSVPEYYALFAELQYAASAAQRMSNASAALPHFVALTFSALEGIAARDGVSSAQYRAAAQAIDASLPAIISSLAEQYSSHALFELVLLPSAPVTNVDAAKLMQRFTSVFDRYHVAVPVIVDGVATVSADDSTLASLCNELNTAVQALGYEVFCPTSRTSFSALELHSSSFALQDATNTTAPTSTVGPQAVQRYQIVLWLSILLGFTVLFAAYSIGFMDNKKDTLLYSKFNPNWGKKQH